MTLSQLITTVLELAGLLLIVAALALVAAALAPAPVALPLALAVAGAGLLAVSYLVTARGRRGAR